MTSVRLVTCLRCQNSWEHGIPDELIPCHCDDEQREWYIRDIVDFAEIEFDDDE